MITPTFLLLFAVVVAIAVVIVAAILRGLTKGGWIKIGLTILGALIGSFAGFFGMFFVYCALRAHRSDPVALMGEAVAFSFLIGAPLGLITFSLIGLWLGSLLAHRAKEKVAGSGEEREQGSANLPP